MKVVNATHTKDEDRVYVPSISLVWFSSPYDPLHVCREKERKKRGKKRKFCISGSGGPRPCVIIRHSTCKFNENTPTLISPIGVLHFGYFLSPPFTQGYLHEVGCNSHGCLWVEATFVKAYCLYQIKPIPNQLAHQPLYSINFFPKGQKLLPARSYM